jgi:broad specificity phosphatase PhoE
MDHVHRFVRPLTPARLEQALQGEGLDAERIPTAVLLSPLRDAIASLKSDTTGTAIDVELVEPVHVALEGLTRSEAADMRMWHWLAAAEFPDLVWKRWRGTVPSVDELPEAARTHYRRFAGTSTLVGVSRNTLARLWWVAEHLEGDYERARFALSNQDMFQAIFERLLGLYCPAAAGCLNRFAGRSEAERRAAARWLNHAASTTVLEVLSEDEIGSIVEESLRASSSA